MAQPRNESTVVPNYIDFVGNAAQTRQRVRRVMREMDEVNRDLARLQERLEEVERQYAEAIKAAYGIIIERKDTTQ